MCTYLSTYKGALLRLSFTFIKFSEKLCILITNHTFEVCDLTVKNSIIDLLIKYGYPQSFYNKQVNTVHKFFGYLF